MADNYDSLVGYWEDFYEDNPDLFVEDLNPDDFGEAVYKLGERGAPRGKLEDTLRKTRHLKTQNTPSILIYEKITQKSSFMDAVRSRQGLKFYDKLIKQNNNRSETLEFGRELAMEEFRSGNRAQGEIFLAEYFPRVLGGLITGEKTIAAKGFRSTFG